MGRVIRRHPELIWFIVQSVADLADSCGVQVLYGQYLGSTLIGRHNLIPDIMGQCFGLFEDGMDCPKMLVEVRRQTLGLIFVEITGQLIDYAAQARGHVANCGRDDGKDFNPRATKDHNQSLVIVQFVPRGRLKESVAPHRYHARRGTGGPKSKCHSKKKASITMIYLGLE